MLLHPIRELVQLIVRRQNVLLGRHGKEIELHLRERRELVLLQNLAARFPLLSYSTAVKCNRNVGVALVAVSSAYTFRDVFNEQFRCRLLAFLHTSS